MKITLPIRSSYAAKDQKKADIATCFVGYGSPRSSTEAYRAAYAEFGLANKGEYTKDDVVFISAEGARVGRVPATAHIQELVAIKLAGAQVVTDCVFHANRPYNIGEREVYTALVLTGFRPVVETRDYRIWQ